MRNNDGFTEGIDWMTVLLYITLTTFGWLNIYAAVYDPELNQSIFDFNYSAGKQLLWIACSMILIAFLILIDYKFYDAFAYIIYGVVILLLMAVLVAGKEVAGSKSWFEIGSIRVQPSEFAKFSTALAIAKYLSDISLRLDQKKTMLVLAGIIGLPVGLIMLQGDTGSAMVFSVFIVVLFIEGLTPIPIILGLSAGVLLILALLIDKTYLTIGFSAIEVLILLYLFYLKRHLLKRIAISILAYGFIIGVIYSVDYVVYHVMKPHQQNRVKALINPDGDPLGYGWNVTQSKIAIGSGGFFGKGFLEGTQTKFDYVPEQSTDFIFCTIGEEHGWIGTLTVISLFVVFMIRLFYLADRQKMRMARVYGYCVASIIFFHFLVNIGMTIGLFPVVGIPLPFFSYGGSSLWSFTILLFIFLNLDASKSHVL
jgi:rod shape determining protein RodA